jgi:hypothetical protein
VSAERHPLQVLLRSLQKSHRRFRRINDTAARELSRVNPKELNPGVLRKYKQGLAEIAAAEGQMTQLGAPVEEAKAALHPGVHLLV